jgi:hypothetical protein
VRPRLRRALALGIVTLAGCVALAPLPAAAVEQWYSRGLYPIVQRGLTTASNLTPFAWLDLWLLTAVGLAVWLWSRPFRRHRGHGGLVALQSLWITIVAGACVYLVFLGCWGLNYRREPLATRLALSDGMPTTEAVVALGRKVVSNANRLREVAHVDGWPDAQVDDARLRAAAAHVQVLIQGERVIVARLKPTLLRWLFRWEGVDAMTNPFGLEVLRNPDLLPFERPFVAAHEWAHLAGFANEAEANFIGWLTCLHADRRSQYSGWLFLYWQLASELETSNLDDLARALSLGVRDDLDAMSTRLRRGLIPAFQRAGWGVYDQYLKANRVKSGVKSYGEVLTLVLRATFDDRWRPALQVSQSTTQED